MRPTDLRYSLFASLHAAYPIRNACILRIAVTLCLAFFVINGQLAHAAKKDPKTIFDQGVKYVTENNLKKAEKNFKKVIKNSPDNYSSYFNLSLLYFHKNDLKQSLKYWLETSKRNPFDTRAQKLLSSTYVLLSKYAESREILSPLSAQNPTDIDSRKKLGIVHLQENNIRSALGEFTITKNLAPSDLDGNLLLATSFALNNNPVKAFQGLKKFRDQLTDDTSLAFYAYLLEKNNLAEDAEALYTKTKTENKENIIPDLIAALQKSVIFNEAEKITYIKEYENLEISKRMADKIKKEEVPGAQTSKRKSRAKRPFGLKAKLTETWEHYNRRPRTSSPINGLNVTTNIKIEGKTKSKVSFSGEWEGFDNRWDRSKLDFYKINANRRNDFEVDIGKFSAKHFPTLISFPTILEGVRYWKKITPSKFEPTPVPEIVFGPIPVQEINVDPQSPVNLGESYRKNYANHQSPVNLGESYRKNYADHQSPVNLGESYKKNYADHQSPVNLGESYRKNYIDGRTFKYLETTFVAGTTKVSKNIGDRRSENEDTFESSGQFEQWTQAYRIKAKFNNYVELGTSLALTQDITNKTIVSSSTEPIESIAFSMDAGLDLLDSDLTIDAEFAYGNYDENTFNPANQHLRDKAWILKSKYNMSDTISLNYEQKAIGRSFKVEGASQTKDKTSHTIDFAYQPVEKKVWFLQSQTIQFKPEAVSPDGNGTTKQKFITVQTVTDIKLPSDSKFIFDSKYYREFDKCGCTNYRTFTFKNSFELDFKTIKTKIKPSYTFERKDDMIDAPTDEKKKEYIFKIENKYIKNLKIDYSWERERKKFNGTTTKSYSQYINTLEFKYDFIPSRFDAKVKLTKDHKNPSDTNKTIISALTFETNFTSKTGDDKLNLKFERKNNNYLPHSDSSDYHQKYLKFKYTRKF